jgi:putative ABC transport system permease protein
VKTRDLLELAGRNLREAKLRNALTTAGVMVGVASLVAMLSLGVGLQELISRRMTRSGLFDLVIVYSRPEFRGFDERRRQRGGSEEGRDLRPLDEEARQELGRLPNVIEVWPEVRFTTEVRVGERTRFTTVSGLSPTAKNDDAFEDIKGSFFSGPEAEETILQIELAKDLSDQPLSLIGQELTLRYAERQLSPPDPSARRAGSPPAAEEPAAFTVVRRERKFRIVGIIENEPFGGLRGFGRGRVFIPVALADQLNTASSSSLRELIRTEPQRKTYQTLNVRLSSPRYVLETEQKIEKMGFSTFSLLEATRNLRRVFAVVDTFLGIFGSLALAVASLGIVNTLVMAILERRREIGIMKAIGASDSDVKKLFFFEAGTMGFLGGAAGVLLGWAIGRAINFGANIYLASQELPPEQIWWVPWWLVAGAIGFSMLVSLAAGLYPASRAAKLDPVQALRYE